MHRWCSAKRGVFDGVETTPFIKLNLRRHLTLFSEKASPLPAFLHLPSRDSQSEAPGFISTLFRSKHVTMDSSPCLQAWDSLIPNTGMATMALQGPLTVS